MNQANNASNGEQSSNNTEVHALTTGSSAVQGEDIEPGTFHTEEESKSEHEIEENLNEQQRMAYDIVVNHLHSHLRQENPPQRLMIVHGPGGMGKTAMLNTISEAFDKAGTLHLLAKTAMSGVAASIVGGQTLHSWAALPIRTPRTDNWIMHPSKEVGNHQKCNITPVLWVTVDEMSMMTMPLLAHLSEVVGVV
jgi:hypothetical protein